MVIAILTRLRGLLQRRRVAREVDDELHAVTELVLDAPPTAFGIVIAAAASAQILARDFLRRF